MSSQPRDISRLKNFPISFFSVVMGLAGLTIAVQKAAQVSYVPTLLAEFFAVVATVVMVALVVVYGAKIIKHPKAVQAEYASPVKVNFFPTIAINLLLLSIVYVPYSELASQLVWWLGAALQLVFMLSIVGGWIWRTKIQITHMSPAWFIPAVGNLIVPVAGVAHAPVEISWFFFAIGTIFWIILMSVFFNRIFFHDMLPEKLVPTLFILLSPPAVMTIALYKLLGEVPLIGVLSYDVALFLFMLLMSRPAQFLKIHFYLSWWAYSFPLAAMAIASYTMKIVDGGILYNYLFIGFLSLTIGLVSVLLVQTAHAVYHKQLCLEED